MNLLLDTHIAIWLLHEPDKLPAGIASLLETGEAQAYVSHISLWEIAIKHPLRRNDAPPRSATDTAGDLLAAGVQFLPLDISHILAFERLPRLHADPFDRLLLAQALAEGMHLVTRDRNLAVYGDVVLPFSG